MLAVDKDLQLSKEVLTEQTAQVIEKVVNASIGTPDGEAGIERQHVPSPDSTHDREDSSQINSHAIDYRTKVRICDISTFMGQFYLC